MANIVGHNNRRQYFNGNLNGAVFLAKVGLIYRLNELIML